MLIKCFHIVDNENDLAAYTTFYLSTTKFMKSVH